MWSECAIIDTFLLQINKGNLEPGELCPSSVMPIFGQIMSLYFSSTIFFEHQLYGLPSTGTSNSQVNTCPRGTRSARGEAALYRN